MKSEIIERIEKRKQFEDEMFKAMEKAIIKKDINELKYVFDILYVNNQRLRELRELYNCL